MLQLGEDIVGENIQTSVRDGGLMREGDMIWLKPFLSRGSRNFERTEKTADGAGQFKTGQC